jgi:hypothetical protein
MEEVQVLYEEYKNLGYSRNMAILKMRNSGKYNDEALSQMAELYSSTSKKKSQDSAASDSSSEAVSMESTSASVPPQQNGSGDSGSLLDEDYPGVDVDVLNSFKQPTNLNIPEYLIPGSPSSDPTTISIGEASVRAPEIKINVSGFLNGNKDPLFTPLLNLSQQYHFDKWARETMETENMGYSMDRWGESKNLAPNMLEVVSNMAEEAVLPEEALKLVRQGVPLRKIVRDNFQMMTEASQVERTYAPEFPGVATKGAVVRDYRKRLREKADEYYKQFDNRFAERFLEEITNPDFTERDEEGNLTDRAKMNLTSLETALRKEYGMTLDLTGDNISGEDKGFWDYVWKRGKRGKISASNGIMNTIDAMGVIGIGLDDEVKADATYFDVMSDQFMDGNEFGYAWNEWTQRVGEDRINQLGEQMTQYTQTYKEAVKNGDWGQAITQMFGATAEGWPYIVPMLLTKRIGPLPSAVMSSTFGLMTRASSIRNDFTFDDFVLKTEGLDIFKENPELKAGRSYSYYEAAEIAGSQDIDVIKEQFDVVENDLARAGYLARTWFGDTGTAYLGIRALRGMTIPQTKNLLTGYAKGMGVALTENGLGIAAATVNDELARMHSTGSDEDMMDVMDQAIWTAIEHSGTTALLFTLGSASRAAENSLSNNSTLSGVLNPKTSRGMMESVREAAARLDKPSSKKSRLEALAVMAEIDGRRNIMYRQNEQYLGFLKSQDKANNTNLFGETVDLINLIEHKKYLHGLTNDPYLRDSYRNQVGQALDKLTDIWNTNQKEFYSSIGAARGVIEREITRDITGEDPKNVAQLLLESQHLIRPRPDDPVPVDDIIEKNTTAAADKAARQAPEWMLKNIEDSEPSTIDRPRLEEILNSEDFAILTGEFPPLQKFTEADNTAALDRAREFLRSNDLTFHEVTGRFDETGERSLLVESMTDAQVNKFLSMFQQHSAVRPRGIVKENGDYANQEGQSWTFEDGVTDKSNDMSAIKLSDGSVVQFKRTIDGFRNKEGEPINSDGFWPPSDEQVVAQEAPPAPVPIQYENNRLQRGRHKVRNVVSRALDWALSLRFGSYKDASGKKVKLNDKDVIETYKSLTRVKGSVDEVTQGDMYNYGAVYTMAGKKGVDSQTFSKILRGEMSFDDPSMPKFSPEERASIEALRSNVDGLSSRLIEVLKSRPIPRDSKGNITEEGKALMQLIDTIENNKGAYLTRSWELFTDGGERLNRFLKKRKEMSPEDRRIFDEAVRFQASQMDPDVLAANPLAAQEAVRGYLKQFAASKDQFGNINVLAVMQNGMLKQKNNAIPMPFQRLLGIIDDPTYEYFATVSKLRAYTTNYEWQQSMAETLIESGLGRYNVSEGAESPLGLYGKMNESAQPHEPLYGMMIPKELESVFSNLDPLRTWTSMVGPTMGRGLQIYTQLSAFGKINHTVLAPTSSVRNFWSGNFLQIAAGHHWLMNPSKSLDAVKMAWPTKAVLGKSQLPSRELWMQERNKLVRGGVLGESVNATDLMRNFQDLIGQDYRKQFADGNVAWETAQRLYAFGDDFYKAMGYYQERAMLIENGMLVEDAEILAMSRIRDMYPTYSNLSRGARELRRFPLAAPFPSFPYEVVRNTKNILKIAAQDIAAGRKDMGVQRILGLTTSMLLIDGVHEASMDYHGFDDEDDEAFRLLGPEWNRLSKMMYIGFDEKTGNAEYIDLSYTFPQEVIMKPIRAILGGDPTANDYLDNAEAAINEGLSPYMGSDMFSGMAYQILSNKDEYGRPIVKTYNDESMVYTMLNDEQAAMDLLQHVFDSYAPGVVKGNMIDFLRATEMVDESNPLYELQYEFQKRYPKTTRYREYTHVDALRQLFGFRTSQTALERGAEGQFYDLMRDHRAMEEDHESRILSVELTPTAEEISNVANRWIQRHRISSQHAIKIANVMKKQYANSTVEDVEGRILTFLMNAGYSRMAAADIYEGRIPDLLGYSEANWISELEKLDNNDILTKEEKIERELNLERSAETYNEIIMNWNDQKNEEFDRKKE